MDGQEPVVNELTKRYKVVTVNNLMYSLRLHLIACWKGKPGTSSVGP